MANLQPEGFGLEISFKKGTSLIRLMSKKIVIASYIVLGLSLSSFGQNMTLSEWTTPTTGSQPLHVVAADSNTFYFTESGRNRLALLNISNGANAITEWPLPAGSMPHGIAYASASNTLYFCAFSGNYVGWFNPATSGLSEWQVPTASAGVIHLDLASSGTIFFTEANGNKVGSLNPVTGQFTEWLIPTANALPRGVVVGQGTQVFVAELNVQKIAMLDTSTNQVSEWSVPNVTQVEHLRFANNLIYFGDLGSSIVGTLDPVGNVITQWKAPTGSAFVPDVAVSGTSFYFTEKRGDKVGLLNPSLQHSMMYSVTPVTTMENPTQATAVARKFSLKGTTTTVAPTITNVSGVVHGGFTEWAVPEAGAAPLGITETGTTVAFAEFYGSKIATLSPVQPRATAK